MTDRQTDGLTELRWLRRGIAVPAVARKNKRIIIRDRHVVRSHQTQVLLSISAIIKLAFGVIGLHGFDNFIIRLIVIIITVGMFNVTYTSWAKNVNLQILSTSLPNIADFHNYFTSTFCGKFAITWLLNISPHLSLSHHALTVLLHYLVKYKFPKITIIKMNTRANTYLLKLACR